MTIVNNRLDNESRDHAERIVETKNNQIVYCELQDNDCREHGRMCGTT
jgi:hypothetical protein